MYIVLLYIEIVLVVVQYSRDHQVLLAYPEGIIAFRITRGLLLSVYMHPFLVLAKFGTFPLLKLF